MVELKDVQDQLAKVGYKNGVWQRAEVKELCNVLHADEQIIQATNGHHEGGFGLLVATDHRLILVDRKPMFLTLDSIAYWMIQEASFTYRLLNSTIHIFTSNKVLDFSSWNQTGLRQILTYTQYAMRQSRPNQITQSIHYANESPPVMQYEVVPRIEAKAPDSNTFSMDFREEAELEPEPEVIPTMPTPPAMQTTMVDDVNLSEDSRIKLGELSVSPADLKTDGRLDPYKAPHLSDSQYARRYL